MRRTFSGDQRMTPGGISMTPGLQDDLDWFLVIQDDSRDPIKPRTTPDDQSEVNSRMTQEDSNSRFQNDPGWPRMTPGWLRMNPRWLMRTPGWLRMNPGWLMMTPGWLKDDSGWLQDDSGWLRIDQDDPRVTSEWPLCHEYWICQQWQAMASNYLQWLAIAPLGQL